MFDARGSSMNSANAKLSASDITPVDYATTYNKKKIFIVGHQDFSIDALVSMLAGHNDNFLVSCVEPGDACMAKFVATEPDVLMIQNEALRDPLERFIQTIMEEYPEIRILVFGKEMDDEHLYRLVRAGVHGYINERMNGEHIKQALDTVLAGNSWIERHIMQRFISTRQDMDQAVETQFFENIDQLCDMLTRREIEILCQVIKGLAIKQIAEEVHLSHQGVKMHLAKLFKKFKVANRNQLILSTFDHISPVEDLSLLLRSGLERRLETAGANN